jgi:hypothetical protein
VEWLEDKLRRWSQEAASGLSEGKAQVSSAGGD